MSSSTDPFESKQESQWELDNKGTDRLARLRTYLSLTNAAIIAGLMGMLIIPLVVFFVGVLILSPDLLEREDKTQKEADKPHADPSLTNHIIFLPYNDNPEFVRKIKNDLADLQGTVVYCGESKKVCGDHSVGYILEGPSSYIQNLIRETSGRKDLNYANWYSSTKAGDYNSSSGGEQMRVRVVFRMMLFSPHIRPWVGAGAGLYVLIFASLIVASIRLHKLVEDEETRFKMSRRAGDNEGLATTTTAAEV